MRVVLILFVCILIYGDLMGSAQIGPISAKNTMFYLALMVMVSQFVLRRRFRFELPGLEFSLLLLAAYATLSMVVMAEIVHFPHYQIWPSFIDLKAILIDWAILFLIFFYGTRTSKEAEGLTRFILLAVSAANVITILNVAGLTDIGVDSMDGDPINPRVKGIFGHENETAAMLAAMLPTYIAVIESRRGAAKLFWIGAMIASAAVMFMTNSRGALVALLIGGAWGAYLCRRYLSLQRALRWATISLAVAVPIVAFVGYRYWDQLMQRFSGSSASSLDELSSGRSQLWTEGVGTMMDKPISLITGYGWDTWALLPFQFIPHNEYLWLWFELGLVGVGCFVIAFRSSIVTALAAIKSAEAESQRMLVGFVVGMLILAVAIFFANLWNPWHYLWPFMALASRSALSILAARRETETPRRAAKPASSPVPILHGARRRAGAGG